jgi:hypothetical protein
MSASQANCPQSKWEYLEITRKTEAYLIGDLNQLGGEGWELVSVTYHRDGKAVGEAWCWTAFLKRPSTGQAVPKATAALSAATRKEVDSASADDPEIFDFQS